MEHISPVRQRKSISLSETTIAYINEYVAMYGPNFTHALEALALAGIDVVRQTGTAVPRPVRCIQLKHKGDTR